MLLTVILVTTVLSAQSSASGRLTGPAQVLGDGKTVFHVSVEATVDDLAKGRVEVRVSAGRVVASRERGPRAIEVDIVPPNVVQDQVMTVELRNVQGHRERVNVRLRPHIPRLGEYRSKGSLSLTVPARMVLGYHTEARLSFRSSSSTPVRLYASAGFLSKPTRQSQGRSVTVYTPPETKFPRSVVVVALSDDGTLVDWAPIQLIGMPLVTARSEANAIVGVRVAGVYYGPIRADFRGRIELRVLAPPGIESAQTIARDAVGNENVEVVNLGVPRNRGSLVLCPPASEQLFVFAADEQGQARTGVQMRVDSSLGSLSKPLQRQGYFVSALSLPATAILGEPVELSVHFEGDQEPASTCLTQVVGEAPVAISVRMDRKVWTPRNAEPVKVRVELRYPGNRTARAVPLVASTDFGSLSELVAEGPDAYEAWWTFPVELASRHQATLKIYSATARPIRAEAVVSLAPGPIASLELSSSLTRLSANGRSRAELVLSAKDAYGNRPATGSLKVKALGSVSEFQPRDDGTLRATYRAPRSNRPGSDLVEVRVAGDALVARREFQLEPVTDTLRLFGHLGYFSNFGRLSGPAATAGAAYHFPASPDGFLVGPEIGFAAADSTMLDSTRSENVDVSVRIIPVAFSLNYELRRSSFSVYGALAPALGFAQLRLRSPSSGDSSTWTTSIGGQASVGGLVPSGPGCLMLVAQYRYLPADALAIRGNMVGLSIGAGYALEL